METIKNKSVQDNQLEEAKTRVQSWEKKYHFSFSTLVFLIFLLVNHLITPVFGNICSISLSVLSLVFIQQTIRSYNYLKFHRVTYRSLVIFHEKINKLIK
jgi:hypothetical protein